ncbi:MAG: 2-oxoglutarate dehydrogenase E1 component [Gemmatimonadaceae bacterium]|nr:2-oxoglutarate dehydrogenase E1 component [Gemmatimonadaceae bacterium]
MNSIAHTSVFNDGFIAEQFERWTADPASVDASWQQYFGIARTLLGGGTPTAATPAGAPDAALLQKVAAAANLIQAIRDYGHLAVPLDPLGTPPIGAAELTPEFHGITEADLDTIPASAFGDTRWPTAAGIVARKREVYSSTIGFEVWHIGEEDEREWFRTTFRDGALLRPLSADEKRAMLRRLTEVDGLERFLGKQYVGAKRFSVEGTDALVPMLDECIAQSGAAGAREIVIAMAHRGRLNVLTNVMGKPYEALFAEFEGRFELESDEVSTGDVKYHLGFEGTRTLADGRTVVLHLVPNPSHLEVVNPVLQGLARAKQRALGGGGGVSAELAVVPIVIHGDAAFPGEGIVAETFNLSALAGYRAGGTIHLIVNNQIGFTTDPIDSRSTHYASDLAKGFEVPIFHVNADNADACIQAVRVACAYRAKFGKDVLIDLVGYRRHGHNEGDEPTFTQPSRYARIKAHPTPREVWGARLVADGLLLPEEVALIEREVTEGLAARHAAMKAAAAGAAHDAHAHDDIAEPTFTADVVPVGAERLVTLNEALLHWPSGFQPHPRLAKQLERRREAIGPGGGIDWGHAEALAFATLLADGTSIRLTGQDAERGTFSHRHAVLHDVESGATCVPLAQLPGVRATFDVFNSPLSETAVLGFEYGYSVAATDTMVMWEAQFGDFANVAQPIIDQFLVADRAKWGQDTGLVLLLPHGYEGQGPEHSSARLERFLQLCAEHNMVVAYPSTPAQYFHVLRRHAVRLPRRPLVLMQPKSLLRLPQAASTLAELAQGTFQAVVDDPTADGRRDEVRRVVFCTGKVYYDLAAAPRPSSVALVRIEQLYPWPHEAIQRAMDRYPAIEQVVWCQEEPRNMGAWTFVQPRLRASAGAAVGVRYVGRGERASPAEGHLDAHKHEQERIVRDALDVSDDDALTPAGGVSAHAAR